MAEHPAERPSAEKDAPLIRWAEVSPEFGSAMPFGSCNAVIEEDEHGGIVCGFPRREDGSCWDGHPAMPTVERHLRVLPPAVGGGHHPRCTGQHETIMGETACVISPGSGNPAIPHAAELPDYRNDGLPSGRGN